MTTIALALLALPAGNSKDSGAAVGGIPFAAATENDLADADGTSGAGYPALTTGPTGSGSKSSVRPRPEFCPPGTRRAGKGCVTQSAAYVVRSERCLSARKAVPYYRFWTHLHQTARDARRLATHSPVVRGKSCRWARYAAREWRARAHVAKASYERWVREHTLRDHESWQAAIREVQVVFPGTAGWMDSCSDAEGMSPSRDREFYVFGFRPFSWGAWYADTVGGPGQIRRTTFIPMYRSGLEYVLARGYRVPFYLRKADSLSWQSMLAQAIAMGWARFTGNDNQHWSASFGRGC